jgi:hypothetical protein
LTPTVLVLEEDEMPRHMINIFTNRHSEYEILLTEHIDGVISATDDAKLTQHLTTCADCAIDLREQSQIRTLLRAEPLVVAPRSFALPYAPRTIETSEPTGITKLLRSMQMATAAAAMILVALVGLNVMQTSPAAVTQTSLSATAPMAESGTALDGQDGSTFMESAPPADTTLLFERAPEAATESGTSEPDGITAFVPIDDAQKASAASPVLPGEFAPDPALALDTTPTTDDRPVLEWALLAASLLTALLALAVVAATWRSRRPA